MASMLSQYLRSSDIHGLRYIVESRTGVAKIVWILCVATCVALAAVVIYFNVDAWSGSPTVITSVEPALVKGLDLMPTVTVCPRTLSYANMLTGLLRSRPELIRDEDVSRVRTAASRMAVALQAEERLKRLSESEHARENPFPTCSNDDNSTLHDPGCKLTHLLYRFARTQEGEEPGSDDLDPLVVAKYLLSLEGARPVLSDLEAHLEWRRGRPLIEFPSGYRTPTSSYSWKEAVELYAKFFDLVDSDGELATPKPVEEYDPPEIPSIGRDNFASLLQHSIDWQVTSSHKSPLINPLVDNTGYEQKRSELAYLAYSDVNEAVVGALQTSLAGYFGKRNVSEVYEVIRAFTYEYYDSTSLPLGDINDTIEHPCDKDTVSAGARSIREVCADDNEVTANCRQYCELVVDRSVQEKVKSLFEMGLEKVGPVGDDGADLSFLSACEKDGRDVSRGCWKRMTNELGVCYTALPGDRTVRGTGEANSFHAALDFSGDVAFSSRASLQQPKLVTVMITPAGEYSVGQYDEDNTNRRLYYYHNGNSPRPVAAVQVDYVTRATPEFRAMSPAKRGCLFSDERPLRTYPEYSEANCLLERAFEAAAKRCGCVPWFLSESFVDGELRADLCELGGTACFRNVVERRFDLSSGDVVDRVCLPDCVTAKYSIKWSDATDNYLGVFDAQALSGNLGKITVNKTKAVESIGNGDVARALILFKGAPSEDVVGTLKLYLSHKTTVKYVRTATVTFIDMISNIGGTLGLFCGFSILSGVEIAYWAGNIVLRRKL